MARARRIDVVLLGLLILAAGCQSRPPQPPDAEAVGWSTYSSAAVGYSLDYPDVYAVQEEEGGALTLFRHEGYPCIAIRYTDERQGRRRGLWHRHDPVGTIDLGGRSGQRFIYDHYDGPFFMHTVSYVVAHRGKSVGLEFRTDGEELDTVQRRVMSSLRFE